MAHLYSISFKYAGISNIAIVYEVNDIVKVTLYDEPLYAVIPGGKFSFNSNNKTVMDENLSNCAQNLYAIIMACIERRKQSMIKLPTVLNTLNSNTVL